MRLLIRKVFLLGSPRPARQVVFSAADRGTEIAPLCRRVGEALAGESAGKVCLVEANLRTSALERDLGRTSSDGRGSLETAGAVRTSSLQITNNLWLVPGSVFVGPVEKTLSVAWLRGRLGELRHEFDYAVIHADTAGGCGSAALFAQLTDGMVLTLEAHRTRRLAAQNIRDQLLATNVRLLGVVLTGRSFPIPEKLYRRL